jgi:hypothetical protein
MLTLINAFCNVVICLSVSAFMVFVFGRLDLTEKFGTVQKWIVKSGLALVSAGALFNFITLSKPPFTEILMNIGLAILFLWAAVFHYTHFVNKDKKKKQ